MYCFFKRCYDDEAQLKQRLHFALRLFDPVSPSISSGNKEEALGNSFK